MHGPVSGRCPALPRAAHGRDCGSGGAVDERALDEGTLLKRIVFERAPGVCAATEEFARSARTQNSIVMVHGV